ncbi:thioredoxin domain-containing protein [Flindersiella endophytica]
MSLTFPGESVEYRTARNLLAEREAELARLTEEVAAARRKLPPGGEIPQDYVFQGIGRDGNETDIKLSELFDAPSGSRDTLVICNFMYGPEMKRACPWCTQLYGPLDRAVEDIEREVAFVVVAKSPLPRILAYARERDWRNLRLLSSGRTTYNRDYNAESAEGAQISMLNVFQRDSSGVIRHFWGAETQELGWIGPHVLDVTPHGQ